jgi:hypothetical protein
MSQCQITARFSLCDFKTSSLVSPRSSVSKVDSPHHLTDAKHLYFYLDIDQSYKYLRYGTFSILIPRDICADR